MYGILVASPLDVELPVQVLDEKPILKWKWWYSHSTTETDHVGCHGCISDHSVDRHHLVPDVNLPEVVQDLVRSAADLYPQEDGSCSGISVAFEYQALPSFFTLEESLPESEPADIIDTGLEE